MATKAQIALAMAARALSGGAGGATVTPLGVAENGTYTAPTGEGYSPVVVDVPEPVGTISITHNGQINVSDYATADVNVLYSLQDATCTGTLDSPWDAELSFSDCYNNLERFQGWIEIDATALGMGTVRAPGFHGAQNTVAFQGIQYQDANNWTAMVIAYNNGALVQCVTIQNGTVTDMTQYASLLPAKIVTREMVVV